MIFEILWCVILFFIILGYLIMWFQSRQFVAREMPKEYVNGSNKDDYDTGKTTPINKPEIIPHMISNKDKESSEDSAEIIDLDNLSDLDDRNLEYEDDDDDNLEVVDLDALDDDDDYDYDDDNESNNKGMTKPEDSTLHYERSFDINDDEIDQGFGTSVTDIDSFLTKKSQITKKQTIICKLNCIKFNPQFLAADEGTEINIVDHDDFDYWMIPDFNNDADISVVPRVCVSSSNIFNPSSSVALSSVTNTDSSKKRNTREVFREDILQISNKNQESQIKRKYAVADMIESEKEYSAALKLLNEIISNVSSELNNFGQEILTGFEKLSVLLSELYEIHDKKLLTAISSCVLNPASVATAILEQKKELKCYPKIEKIWKILKDQLLKSNEKNIHLLIKDSSKESKERTKMSIASLNQLMLHIESKLYQYCASLCDIMRYTGRLGSSDIGEQIYLLQKAITTLHRIVRSNGEEKLIQNFNEKQNLPNERLVRITDNVMVTNIPYMRQTYSNLTRNNERIRLILMTKTKLIFLNKMEKSASIEKILDISNLKLFQKDNFGEKNELFLWNKLGKAFEILLLYFPTRFSSLSWQYELKRRINKSDKNNNGNYFLVSLDDIEQQYKSYLSLHQTQVAVERESITLESASIDSSYSPFGMETTNDSTNDSSSELIYISAQTGDSHSSDSYKTARDTIGSSTDKATRPVSGISLDSYSTLDGVRTPFSEDEYQKSITAVTEEPELSITEMDQLQWTILLTNYDPEFHNLEWYLAGQTQKNQSNCQITMTPLSRSVTQWLFTKKDITKLETGILICKVIDRINGCLITSVTTNVMLTESPKCEIEFIISSDEITGKEGDSIKLELLIKLNGKLPLKSLENFIIWYKDNEPIKIDKSRLVTNIDESNKKLVLTINNSSCKDAGIYTIGVKENQQFSIENAGNLSILVLIERVKKTIFKTASQEDNLDVDENEMSSISPMKEINVFSWTTDDSDQDKPNDTNLNMAISTTRHISELADKALKCDISKMSINEFEDLFIPIIISSQYKGSIKWYFNGNPLQTDTKINISNKGLLINKCGIEYRGTYRCEAEGTDDKIQIDVIVNESERVGSITCNIEEVDLCEGEDLSISLSVDNININNIQKGKWILNDKILNISDFGGSMNILNNNISLIIPNMEMNLKGLLYFIVNDLQEIRSPRIEIKIRKGKAKTKEKEIKKPAEIKSDKSRGILEAIDKELSVKKGNDVVLKVKVVEESSEPIEWYFKDILIKESKNISSKYDLKTKICELVIKGCTKEQEGIYKCSFKGSDECQIITVKVILDQVSSLLECDIEEIDLECGETLNLKLRSSGIDKEDLLNGKWKLNKKDLNISKVGGDCKFSDEGVELTIPDVDEDMKGMLKFEVNKIPSPEIEIKIRKGKLISNKSLKKSDISNVVKSLGKLPKELFVNESKNIEIEIKLLSDPGCTLEWYFQNKLLKESTNVFIQQKSSLCLLTLKQCTKEMEGIYKCVNPKLSEIVDTNLKVVKTQRSGFLNCEIEELDLVEGGNLKLILAASDIDLTSIEKGNWYLNNNKINLLNIGGTCKFRKDAIELFIKNVKKTVEGNLKFKIDTNKLKVESPEIVVKIRSDKLKPEQLIVRPMKSEIVVNENELLNLEFHIQQGKLNKYKSPKVLFNDKALEAKNPKIDVSKTKIIISIEQSHITDSGQYFLLFEPDNGNEGIYKTESILVIVNKLERNMKVASPKVKAGIGDCVTLCVETEGFRSCDIKWTKLGNNKEEVSVANNSRFTEKFSNNLALLLIDHLQRDDSSTYLCKGLDNKEFVVKVEVELIVIDKSISKCHIAFENNVYEVEYGRRAIMRAEIKCKSTHYSVAWMFNGEMLEMNQGIHSDIVDNGNVTELMIDNCQIERSGHYSCRIESKDGHVSIAETKLVVLKKSGFEDVKEEEEEEEEEEEIDQDEVPDEDDDEKLKGDIIDSPSSVRRCSLELFENDKLELEISHDRKPSEIKWIKNNEELTDLDNEFQLIEKDDKMILMKTNVELEDSGIYKCNVRKPNGNQINYEFTVYVESSNDKVSNVKEALKVKSNTTTINVVENQSFVLSVEIENFSNVCEIDWLKNNEALKPTSIVKQRIQDLIIEKSEKSKHEGEIICKVFNKDTGENVKMNFKIKFIESKYELTELLSCTVEEVDLEVGQQLNISIATSQLTESLPEPIWLKDELLLDTKDSRLKLITRPMGYNLILKNVQPTDAGLYCIKVEDDFVEVVVRVRAVGKAGKIKSKIPANMKAPVTSKKLENKTVDRENDMAKFEFEIDPCGPTKAVWYFEDKQIEIENSEFIQWSHDNFFALTIPSVLDHHCGEYSIKVTNTMGCVKSAAKLSIRHKKQLIGDNLSDQNKSDILEESCCISPKFTKKLKNSDLSTGDSIRLSCRIVSEPEPKILWTKNGETMDSKNSDRKMRIVNDFPNYYLTVTGIDCSDAGRYCCLASNFLGYDTTEALITIDGLEGENSDENFEEDDELELKRLEVKPLTSPMLTIEESNSSQVVLVWNTVLSSDDSPVIYSIEKQKSFNSLKWKEIVKNITDTRYILSSNELSNTESHILRCVAETDFGHRTYSNPVTLEIKLKPPVMVSSKPKVTFKDISCALLSWLPAKNPSNDQLNKVYYTIEMKDNAKSNWQVLQNELTNTDYSLTLEPGVSYMFRIFAYNNHGTSDPSQSVICRIDRLKLVPDFSSESPWLHMQGQPCLKWRPAIVPEYCDKCVEGIAPEYKVEYRTGRMAPWKVYENQVIHCYIYLSKEILENAYEFRVSCHNRFGQNGPTRSYRVQNNLSRSSRNGSLSFDEKSIITHDDRKNCIIDSMELEELSLRWEKWSDSLNDRYIIQRQCLTSPDWEQLDSIIFGENCTIDFKLTENFGRQLRIIALDELNNTWHDGYHNLSIPSKQELLPLKPTIKDVVYISNDTTSQTYHEITWNNCTTNQDYPANYILQYKIDNYIWTNLSDNLTKCNFMNIKVDIGRTIFYRVAAKNQFGLSDYSDEIKIQTPTNQLTNEPIIKSIRYYLINPNEVELKWQLTDTVFDCGILLDNLSYQIEKKVTDKQEWSLISNVVDKTSVVISVPYADDYLYRIQPYYEQQKLTTSKVFRIYIAKDSVVPDMSFTRLKIEVEPIHHECLISWPEPDLSGSGFPLGMEDICPASFLLGELEYQLEIAESANDSKDSYISKRYNSSTSISSSRNLQWNPLTTEESPITDNHFTFLLPDPTKEYWFRIIATNRFGSGSPSRITRLAPQITLPDFSLIRPTIDKDTKGNSVTLTWTSPKSLISESYTPISVDVQYKLANSEEWLTYKSGVRRNKVDISELQPQQDLLIRLMPVTDFGQGQPSIYVRRVKLRTSNQQESSLQANAYQDHSTASSEIYGQIAQKMELNFSKIHYENINQYKWQFQQNDLEFNENVFLVSSSLGNCILMIQQTSDDDFGQYSAVSIDEDNTNSLQTITLIKADSPTFISGPISHSVSLHDTVDLVVHVQGQPPPTVTWRRNYSKIYSSYRTRLKEDVANEIYILTITKALSSDIGEYCVRAENVIGYSEMKFHLKVDVQPDSKNIYLREADVNERYYVMKQISKGSFSICQKLVEKSTQKEFVGKFFNNTCMDIGKMELECVRNIHHRNVIELIDAMIKQDQTGVVLIYERVDGLNLIDYLKSLNNWNESIVRLLWRQLLQGVSHLHSYSVCHLDIQPVNLIIVGKYHDTLKLIGFSNARIESSMEHTQLPAFSPYSAPELVKGQNPNFTCDMWSIGILTMISLVGDVSSDKNNFQISCDNQTTNQLHPDCLDFINRCLNVNKDERLTSQEATKHPWLMTNDNGKKTDSKYIEWSLDYLLPNIIKLMTYPEEMVPKFPKSVQECIESYQTSCKPILTLTKNNFENPDTNENESLSPTISQMSSRASSVSRDGINYENLEMSNENEDTESKVLVIQDPNIFQAFPDNFVSQATKELIFTVPLQNQTFLIRPFESSRTQQYVEDIVANLTCQLTAAAPGTTLGPVTVSWYRGPQQLLTDGARTRLEVTGTAGYLSCSLLGPARDSDAGVYRCVARSRSLKAETSARLVQANEQTAGRPPQLSSPPYVSFQQIQNDEIVVVLTWLPYFTLSSTIDDLIYRIDLRSIGTENSQWEVHGYSVDNRYIITDLSINSSYIARVLAHNKYGYGNYSVASGIFNLNNKTKSITLKPPHHRNQFDTYNNIINFSLTDRQNADETKLYDVFLNIRPEDINMDFLNKYYQDSKTLSEDRTKSILQLTDTSIKLPRQLIKRDIKESRKTVSELLLRIHHYHFPLYYGKIQPTESENYQIIEEFIPGGQLFPVLLARHQYSEYSVYHIVRQTLEALSFLHCNRLVHCNVIPSNLLVNRRANQLLHIKLTGLGKCCQIGTVNQPTPASLKLQQVLVEALQHSNLESQKNLAFQSPESRHDTNVVPESDIWSLGVLTYLLLCGNLPTIEQVASDLESHQNVKAMSTLAPPMPNTQFKTPDFSIIRQCSKDLCKFVYNSLKRNPNHRGTCDYWISASVLNLSDEAIATLESHTINAEPLNSFI